MTRVALALMLILAVGDAALALGTKPAPTSLSQYLERVQGKAKQQQEITVPGSLWTPHAEFSSMVSDNVAHRVNDTVVIQIMDETVAEATGAVTTQRSYGASSAITALPGKFNTGGLNPLLNLSSKENLKGTGQTASHSKLRSSLAGRVVALLSGGSLVIEARKIVVMNNEQQTVTLRGIARQVDIAPENTVQSTQMSDLEIEVNGKGVISDSTRRPHWLLRVLTRFLTF